MDLFGDFGFAGASDATATPYQDAQVCINWYPEVAASNRAKVAVALLGAPGLVQLAAAPGGGAPGFSSAMSAWPQPSAITNLPVRGMWVLSGMTQALAVIGNICYLVTITTPASAAAPAVLAITSVGALGSASGPVSIRDDGLGGYAVIVDGPNGYIYTIATKKLVQITDPAWLGSTTVAFIDGWWIFNQPGTQTFYTNAQPYSITFDATYFANKDAASDKLLGIIESKEELWLIGERTTEVWYNAGGQYFPFQRLVGTLMQVGCKAPFSIVRTSTDGADSLTWFARTERGENVIVRTSGFQTEVISTPAVSHAIAQYALTSDAIAYAYSEDAHQFYVLNFPSADRTWVFDGSVPPEFAWTERRSYDPYAQALHRHRSNAFMNFAGMRVVGDYQNGALYQLTRSAYTDAGWPILARRRSPYVWDTEAATAQTRADSPRGRVFLSSLQLEFAGAPGASSGLGANPIANLRISRDGVTFGQQWPAPMGSQGQFTTRTMWRRLSCGRRNLFEVEVIAPVNRDLLGATLKAASMAGA